MDEQAFERIRRPGEEKGKLVASANELQIGDQIQIRLLNVKQAPYAINGKYCGTQKLSEHSLCYIVVEGTVGDDIGREILTPEPLVQSIIVYR